MPDAFLLVPLLGLLFLVTLSLLVFAREG